MRRVVAILRVTTVGSSGRLNAKSDVDSVLPDLKASVGENQMRLQARMLSHEFGKQRRDPPSAKLYRRSDLQ